MHRVVNNETANSGDKNKKQNVISISVVYCGLLSALPLVVGLTGAISASISAEYNAPTWNLKIGCVALAAGVLGFCAGFEDYIFAVFMSLLGVSWLGGVYAQQQHPFILFGGTQLPIYTAFLMTAMLGALVGLCCGAVNLVAYCCFVKPAETRSDLAALENMRNMLQQPLDRSLGAV